MSANTRSYGTTVVRRIGDLWQSLGQQKLLPCEPQDHWKGESLPVEPDRRRGTGFESLHGFLQKAEPP